MTGKIINGKALAKEMEKEIRQDVDVFFETYGRRPSLTVVLVGEDPASKTYVKGKEKSCKKVGIDSNTMHLPASSTSERELLKIIKELNSSPNVDGILVQLPLPKHIDEHKVLTAISPTKDVDGFHPENLGLLLSGNPRTLPCTPAGIHEILKREGVFLEGKHVVVVGRSNIVGKPISMMLVQKDNDANATVTMTHSRTKDLSSITRTADVIICAVGFPGAITGDMVKEGVVAIDVGINRVNDPDSPKGYRVVGDIDFDSVSKKASLITPVPGGVGLMTRVFLMNNTLQAAYFRMKSEENSSKS